MVWKNSKINLQKPNDSRTIPRQIRQRLYGKRRYKNKIGGIKMVKWTLEFDGMPVYDVKNAWVMKKKNKPIVMIEGIGILKGYYDKTGHECNLQFRIHLKLCKKIGLGLIKRTEKIQKGR